VNTRLEGLVDCTDSVGSQEEKTVIVLKNTEEDGDKSVTLHVLLGSLREEHVRLVKQKNTVPEMSKAEDVLQRRLNLMGCKTKITASNDKQWLAVLHSDSLSGGRLSNTRNTMQKHNETTALALDQILARTFSRGISILALKNLSLEVRHDKSTDDILVIALNPKVLKDTRLASHGLEDIEIDGQEATLAKSISEHTLRKKNKILIAKLQSLGVGLKGSAALDTNAEESVNGEVVPSLTGLNTIGVLDDLILRVCHVLASAVEPMLDRHLVILDLASGRLVDRELMESRAPVRHLLVSLGEIDDDITLDELGMTHLLIVLVIEDLLFRLGAMRRGVSGQSPGAVLLVAIIQVVDELAALVLH